MFKVGDLVTRNSHDNDVEFKIIKIIDNVAYLKGLNVRLCADSEVSDLNLIDNKRKDESDSSFYDKLESLRKFDRSDYFYLPGKILHVDTECSLSK